MITSLDLGSMRCGGLRLNRVSHGLRGLATALQRSVQPDIDVAVALVVGMEGHADGQAVDLEEGLDLAGVLVVLDGEQAAWPCPEIEVVDDEQAVGAGLGGQGQGLLDVQLGEGPHDLVRRQRVGRADDARVVPGDSSLEAEGFLGGRAIVGQGQGRGGDQGKHEDQGAQRTHSGSLSIGRIQIMV